MVASTDASLSEVLTRASCRISSAQYRRVWARLRVQSRPSATTKSNWFHPVQEGSSVAAELERARNVATAEMPENTINVPSRIENTAIAAPVPPWG